MLKFKSFQVCQCHLYSVVTCYHFQVYRLCICTNFIMRKGYCLLLDLNRQIIIKIAELLMRNLTPTIWWQILCLVMKYLFACFSAYKWLTKMPYTCTKSRTFTKTIIDVMSAKKNFILLLNLRSRAVAQMCIM